MKSFVPCFDSSWNAGRLWAASPSLRFSGLGPGVGWREGTLLGCKRRGLFKHLVHVISALWTQAPVGVCPVP